MNPDLTTNNNRSELGRNKKNNLVKSSDVKQVYLYTCRKLTEAKEELASDQKSVEKYRALMKYIYAWIVSFNFR